MKTKSKEPQGLAAVIADERLTDAERGRWIDLCMNEHEQGARVRAMYIRRMAGTPDAPSGEQYREAHAQHLATLEDVQAMRQRFGGFIAWPDSNKR